MHIVFIDETRPRRRNVKGNGYNHGIMLTGITFWVEGIPKLLIMSQRRLTELSINCAVSPVVFAVSE